MSATDGPIVASSDQDDRVMFVGGHTMLLERGSPGRKIAEWLKFDTADMRAFEIGDQAFVPNSAELTPRGWAQLARFSQIMKGHLALKAHIMVSSNTENSPALQLEEARARHLRDEVVAQGVPPSRMTALGDSDAIVPTAKASTPAGGKPQLLVLLSRK